MKSRARLCALLALIACPLLALAQTSNLVFLESPDAKGTLDRGQMVSCMTHLVQELELGNKELPTIMVLHVSEKVGGVAGLQEQTTLRRNVGKSGPPTYYELWIVGPPQPAQYITAFEQILEKHFDMNLSGERRARVMTQIARYVKNTVSVYHE